MIDVGGSTLASEELPPIVERRFIFPNILPDGGAPSLEDLGHHAGYYKLPKSQGARFIYLNPKLLVVHVYLELNLTRTGSCSTISTLVSDLHSEF